MHSFHWTNNHPGYGDPEEVSREGDKVSIHHNGDYSGEAIINMPEEMWHRLLQSQDVTTYEGVRRVAFKLPANLLKAFGNNATIRDAISALEDLYMAEG